MQENTQQRTRKRSLRDSSLRICAVSRSRRNSSRCDIVCAILLGPTFASVNTHRELPVTSAPETLAGTQSLNVRSLREHTASSFLAIALSLSLSLSLSREAREIRRASYRATFAPQKSFVCPAYAPTTLPPPRFCGSPAEAPSFPSLVRAPAIRLRRCSIRRSHSLSLPLPPPPSLLFPTARHVDIASRSYIV